MPTKAPVAVTPVDASTMRGEAEVGQVDALVGALALDQDVAGLDVAVDEAARVGGVERRGDLGDHGGGVLGAHRAVGPSSAAQVGAVDQVHGHEQQAVLLAGVVDRDHVRVADRDRDPRLLAEAAAEALVGGELRRDDLERDDVVERQVGRLVDDAHPPLPASPSIRCPANTDPG